MCKPCNLHAIRLRVTGEGPVPLCPAGSFEPVAAIRRRHGWLSGIVGDNGWMGVFHPEKGLLGLPLSGRKYSWKTAWENDTVSIQAFTKNGWIDIEDWEKIEGLTAPN